MSAFFAIPWLFTWDGPRGRKRRESQNSIEELRTDGNQIDNGACVTAIAKRSNRPETDNVDRFVCRVMIIEAGAYYIPCAQEWEFLTFCQKQFYGGRSDRVDGAHLRAERSAVMPKAWDFIHARVGAIHESPTIEIIRRRVLPGRACCCRRQRKLVKLLIALRKNRADGLQSILRIILPFSILHYPLCHKSLRTFLDDMRRAYPSEVVSISKTVNPLTYDVTAIVKQLGALKKFPVLIFEHPLNAHGQASDMKIVMSAENSQKKIQVALGVPREMDRAEMARECLRREAGKIGPVIVSKDAAPVKEIIQTGDRVDLYELPLSRITRWTAGPISICRASRKTATAAFIIAPIIAWK